MKRGSAPRSPIESGALATGSARRRLSRCSTRLARLAAAAIVAGLLLGKVIEY
jgi:hypothetical protein